MNSTESLRYIEINPCKRNGKPCISGTNMAVSDVLELIEKGVSEEEILAEFENLDKPKLRAALAYAACYINLGRRPLLQVTNSVTY